MGSSDNIDSDDNDSEDKNGTTRCDDENVFDVLYNDVKTHAPEGRILYLSRHGESESNRHFIIGGDACLSVQGQKYSSALAAYFNAKNLTNLKIWTSKLKRTRETVGKVVGEKFAFSQLNEINGGDLTGLSYDEIESLFPVEYAKRDQDKLRYRYPNGESYLDICRRLTDILPEMNRSENLLVVSHQAVIRCIVAYMTACHLDDVPYINIPLHSVVKVTMKSGQNVLEFIPMSVECVDTYRARPSASNCSLDIVEAITSIPVHL